MKKFLAKLKPSTLLQAAALVVLFVFLVLPLIFMLTKISGDDFSYVFNDTNLYKAFGNSLLYSFIGAVISILLATLVAYFLSRLRIKRKNIIVLFLILPMLIPTISIGLGVRTLFGTNGFLDQWFGLKYDGIGFFNLIFGSVVFSFPVAFLLIYDAFLYEDRSVYDAANTLGISRIRSFFGITLPYLRTTLISAFFVSFVLIFADYGLPMEVAGKVKTLPMYLYEQVLTQFKYGRGAAISLILLIPAVVAFVVDIFNKEEATGVAKKEEVRPSKSFNIVAGVSIGLVVLVLLLPQFCFVAISLVKRFPSDMTLTFENYINGFSPYSSVSILSFLINSLIIAGLTALIGTIVTYVCGYLTSRSDGKLSKPLHLLCLASLALPGLVLGVGYVFLFSNSWGWFAGTIWILITVNMVHYFSSPYLLARNALNKINKDYEVVASTLGISKVSLFFKVIVPNSLSSILQMFSYLFINSMITISAVSFLCRYSTQPLAVSIATYESQAVWEMESVISTLILLINVVIRVSFNFLSKAIERKIKNVKEEKFDLSKIDFDILTYIEENNKTKLTERGIAEKLTISVSTIARVLASFVNEDYLIIHNDGVFELTEKGYRVIEPYKVKKAIILAAGFGSRLAPVSLDTPKPLVKVNGVRIIDNLLDAFYEVGIKNIVIVTGYKAEMFNELLEKYPTIRFVKNDAYNETNNISSLYVARDYIDRCYICEADLILKKKHLITKYQYCSNYLGAFVHETDDWCFTKKGNYISKIGVGGESCYHMFGISYWSDEDSKKLVNDIEKVYASRGGKEKFWDMVPLSVCKKNYKVEIRECKKKDIVEIDNYSELVEIDPSYANYQSSFKF